MRPEWQPGSRWRVSGWLSVLLIVSFAIAGCTFVQPVTSTPTPAVAATATTGTPTRGLTVAPATRTPSLQATQVPTSTPLPPQSATPGQLTPIPSRPATPLAPTTTLTPTPPPPADPVCYSSKGRSNLYAGPSTMFGVLVVLGIGEEVRPVARNQDATWLQVITLDGIQGWLQYDLISCRHLDLSGLPVVSVAPPTPVPSTATPALPTATPLPPTPTPVPPTPTPIVISDWRGEYYATTNLSGAPALIRNDPAVSFNWGTGSPAATIPSDRFAVRWTRDLDFAGGLYRFQIQVDDGVRFWFDGMIVLDQWRPANTTYIHDMTVAPGRHNLRIEYYENAGGALIFFTWQRLPDTIRNYRGEYYNSENLQGNVVLVRDDPVIDFIWGDSSPGPGVNSDSFSVRWTGRPSMQAGLYQLRSESDDGLRVWINGILMIDNWQAGRSSNRLDMVIPTSGPQDVRVEYFERTSTAYVHVWWQPTRGPQ